MGLSKEEAYRILGLPDGSSQYVVRAHYRRLANRYHPDKNLHNREVALQKFQKVVEAYVRLQIEPDDCDQLKMKMILTELYAINEDILAGEYSYSDESDSELTNETSSALVPYRSSSSSSQKGPYADVLQDFMLRSYMSGGRKTKPSVNMGTEKKRYASEREFALATKHADELLLGEEQERKKEEKRKQKNKKKKEAKKKKKDQKPSNGTRSPDLTKINFSNEEDEDGEDDEEKELKFDDEDATDFEIRSVLSEIGNGLDMSSAFFSRVTSKLSDKPTKSSSTSEEGGKKKSNGPAEYTKKTGTSSSSSIEYSSTTESEKHITNSWSTSSSSSSSVDVVEPVKSKDKTEGKGKGEGGGGGGGGGGSDKAVEKKHKDEQQHETKETQKPSTVAAGTTTKGGTVSSPAVYKVARRPHKPAATSNSRQFPSNLPPRLVKLQQQQTKNGHKFNKGQKRNDKPNEYDEEEKEEDERKDDRIVTKTEPSKRDKERESTVHNERSETAKKQSEQYSPEAVLKNGESCDLDQSRKMAVLGNRAAKEGRFQDAVLHFTKAIEHYSFDLRYFGNRSFCYEYMKEYELALQDANEALKIDTNWPKGHFRKAKALVGLKMYEKAEESFEKAISFDPNYTDAKEELRKTKVKRLTSMGYDESIAKQTLAQFDDNVQDAIESLKTTISSNVAESEGSSQEEDEEEEDRDGKPSTENMTDKSDVTGTATKTKKSSKTSYSSLWIGNINPATITEGMLLDTFKKCGTVKAVQILTSRYCAFVEFSKPSEASYALKTLQDCTVGDCNLLLKIPDNPYYSLSSRKAKEFKASTTYTSGGFKKTGPVNGNECYFWRTNGCSFGSKCRYRHIVENRGIDKKLNFT